VGQGSLCFSSAFDLLFFSSFLPLFSVRDTNVRSKGLELQWVAKKLENLALAPFVELAIKH